MVRTQIVHTSDKDGSFLEGALQLHFIVSGDGDTVGANCQCASDAQVVVQITLRSRVEFAVWDA